MCASKFDISFINPQGPATQKPNPAYPSGVDVDLSGGKPSCKVDLPYPARERGQWMVVCRACGLSTAITAAGRRDDPRSIRVPCKLGIFVQ